MTLSELSRHKAFAAASLRKMIDEAIFLLDRFLANRIELITAVVVAV